MRDETPALPVPRKWRILWLESEKSLAELFQTMIGTDPWTAGACEVSWVDHGDAARHALAQKLPAIFVTDIKHPGCRTVDLLRWLQVQHACVPVIVCTGYSPPTALRKLRRLFATKFAGINITVVIKPCSTEELLQALREACQLVRC